MWWTSREDRDIASINLIALFRKIVPLDVRLQHRKHRLKDKSGIGIIVDYSKHYTIVNGVKYFFQFFSLLIYETIYFNLLRCAK